MDRYRPREARLDLGVKAPHRACLPVVHDGRDRPTDYAVALSAHGRHSRVWGTAHRTPVRNGLQHRDCRLAWWV
jgi:hypothetical protein